MDESVCGSVGEIVKGEQLSRGVILSREILCLESQNASIPLKLKCCDNGNVVTLV